jgi:hypothetical protein
MQKFSLLLVTAAAFAAAAAESVHGWGLVDWGMTEAQVQSAYGDMEKLPVSRVRRSDIVELLRLKNPLVINGIALTQSFAFSHTGKGLERVVLRANLTNASSEQCQDAYGRIRLSEIKQFAQPVEEKAALRSLHAIWHGAAADAQLSIMDVTGHCFVTLVYEPPGKPSEGKPDPADKPTVPAR